MLIAQNEKNKLITANQNLSKNANYYCPSCKHPVHLKVGTVIQTHFAHYQNQNCTAFSEGETPEHLKGKIQIAQTLGEMRLHARGAGGSNLEFEMEAYLPELKQRPDLLVTTGNRKIALEFQCSAIPIELVEERTRGYLKAGYEVIWILGQNFQYKNNLTAFQRACLSLHPFSEQKRLCLFNYDVDKDQLTIRSDFQVQWNEKMTCKKKIWEVGNKFDFTNREQFKPSVRSQTDLKSRHQKLFKEMRSPASNTRSFFQLLYQNSESIISMPLELYQVVPNEWLLQTNAYEWKYHFVLWLESLPKGRILTKDMLNNWVEAKESSEEIKYFIIPQMNEQQKLAPFYEFIKVLLGAGMLNEVRPGKWSIQKKLQRYKMLEDKFN